MCWLKTTSKNSDHTKMFSIEKQICCFMVCFAWHIIQALMLLTQQASLLFLYFCSLFCHVYKCRSTQQTSLLLESVWCWKDWKIIIILASHSRMIWTNNCLWPSCRNWDHNQTYYGRACGQHQCENNPKRWT